MSRQPRAFRLDDPNVTSGAVRGDGGAPRRHRGGRRRRRADGPQAPGALGRHPAVRPLRPPAARARARHREPHRRPLSRSRPGSAGWRSPLPFSRRWPFWPSSAARFVGIWREQKIEQPARGRGRRAGRQGPQGRQEHRGRSHRPLRRPGRSARQGSARLKGLTDEIIDADDRLAIAERELLAPLDAQAKRAIAGAAKQVSLVTAVSPRAIVDVAFVVFAAVRLLRTLARIYGGRPGLLRLPSACQGRLQPSCGHRRRGGRRQPHAAGAGPGPRGPHLRQAWGGGAERPHDRPLRPGRACPSAARFPSSARRRPRSAMSRANSSAGRRRPPPDGATYRSPRAHPGLLRGAGAH